jgi:hypothetical protein
MLGKMGQRGSLGEAVETGALKLLYLGACRPLVAVVCVDEARLGQLRAGRVLSSHFTDTSQPGTPILYKR